MKKTLNNENKILAKTVQKCHFFQISTPNCRSFRNWTSKFTSKHVELIELAGPPGRPGAPGRAGATPSTCTEKEWVRRRARRRVRLCAWGAGPLARVGGRVRRRAQRRVHRAGEERARRCVRGHPPAGTGGGGPPAREETGPPVCRGGRIRRRARRAVSAGVRGD